MAAPEYTGKNPYVTVCKRLGFEGANRLVHCTRSQKFRCGFSGNLSHLAKGDSGRDKLGI